VCKKERAREKETRKATALEGWVGVYKAMQAKEEGERDLSVSDRAAS